VLHDFGLIAARKGGEIKKEKGGDTLPLSDGKKRGETRQASLIYPLGGREGEDKKEGGFAPTPKKRGGGD